MEPIKKIEGSSKNILVYKEASANTPGEGTFEFTDYFSVFDWGRFLNEAVPGKGEAMAAVVKKYFELLDMADIKHHYKGMAGDNLMNVSLVNIPKSYTDVAPGTTNYLLPIEIIFRIYTHPESSDLRKIKEGKRTFTELGYEGVPEPNKRLPHTKISYSTKLEETDRILSRGEAAQVSGLAPVEMDRLEDIARRVCDIITTHSQKIGLIHYDGKIEMAKDTAGNLVVIDVLGTLDEDRFMMDADNGNFVDISKQFIRNWYKNSGWKKDVDAAKKKAEELNDIDWKKYCPKPPQMPQTVKNLVVEMYLADAKDRGGIDLGPKFGINVRPLSAVAKDIYSLQQNYKK